MNAPATNTVTLDELAEAHAEAKAEVAAAQAKLDQINSAICKIVGTKDEGSFSVDGDSYRITTTQPITRSVDSKLAKDVYAALPRDIADGIFSWKPSLNLKLYRELEKYQPEHFKTVARSITSKPGKPQIKVSALEVSA
jgi:hypothetical protein